MFKLIIPYRNIDNPRVDIITFNTEHAAILVQKQLASWEFKSILIDDFDVLLSHPTNSI